ncbi:unnamed protein product, partial [Rotaria sp. Silwood1]
QEKSQKDSQIEIQISSTIDNQQSVEYKKSKTSIKSSTINEKSLDTNQINEQIHELLNNYDTILQKHIKNDQAELSKIQTDIDQIEIQTDKLSSAHIEQESNKIMHQQTIDTIEDLHQLSILVKQKDKIPLLIHNNLETSLEKFQQENNREKQIDIQLQILDKIDQLDNQFINHKTLENLRKHLHEEQKQQQGSIILSSNRQIHSDTHIQIIPVPIHLSKSPTMTIVEEKQIKNISHQTTIKPTISELIPKIDSVEQTNLSLVTTNAKELYQELQKMKYSIEMVFENTQQVSDIVDVKVPSRIPLSMKIGIAIEHDEEYYTTDTIHKIRVPSQSLL